MFDKYPYTNFHEMNLDWIIQEMKQLVDDWEEFSGRVSAEAHASTEPEVTITGDLKEGLVFDFGLVEGPKGATGAQGVQGEQGPQGEGLQILDTYPTLADLQSAHPTGSAGDAYLVGSGGVFTLYIWSVSGSAWTDAGSLSSPSPSNISPVMNGTASAGSSTLYSRGDHVHPSDTSKLDKSASNGVYAVDSGSQVMLNYSDNSLAEALVQYDSTGDINAVDINASGTVSANSLTVTNNNILNSQKLAGIGVSSNAYQVLTTSSSTIDPLILTSDATTDTPVIKFTGAKVDNTGTINTANSEVRFTDSFDINDIDYTESHLELAKATASRRGGIKMERGTISEGTAAASTQTDFTVTFSNAFDSIPQVLAVIYSYTTYGDRILNIVGVIPTSTDMVIRVLNTYTNDISLSGARRIEWIAFGS